MQNYRRTITGRENMSYDIKLVGTWNRKQYARLRPILCMPRHPTPDPVIMLHRHRSFGGARAHMLPLPLRILLQPRGVRLPQPREYPPDSSSYSSVFCWQSSHCPCYKYTVHLGHVRNTVPIEILQGTVTGLPRSEDHEDGIRFCRVYPCEYNYFVLSLFD